MNRLLISRATAFVHKILQEKIQIGNIVVDATMGNGNDTIFLSQAVGSNGKVYAFDIQQKALDITYKRLLEANCNNVVLIRDSHENMGIYIKEKIDAAVFNLGYLPKGDHKVITKPPSTIGAIKSSLEILKTKGILSIVIYYGHEGGAIEKNSVIDFLETLDNKKYSVLKCSYISKEKNPPIIVFIEKII
ncbi:methyltransferase domain-containing protein [Alkaliphilus pronyensis]|uniref:Methyltransferase domain-containing protein n=1 Tax=Alkaliphilus pronyensis TaxID=1482732 RepID=A0A6I0F737_9FIRM|nr:class I SAM-dependent methyltransferase [Alkaliphilus pronyensis]KAB3534006.1 methyltransferase domain-containing protein [Alkaliphilus pronyensis]